MYFVRRLGIYVLLLTIVAGFQSLQVSLADETWNKYKWQWKFQTDGLFADLTRASDSHYDCYL